MRKFLAFLCLLLPIFASASNLQYRVETVEPARFELAGTPDLPSLSGAITAPSGFQIPFPTPFTKYDGDQRYLGPKTNRYVCYPDGTSDANAMAAVAAAYAAGGGEIDIPPGATTVGGSTWAEIKSNTVCPLTGMYSLPLINGITYRGTGTPQFTFPLILADSGVTFTGGTVLVANVSNNNDCFEGFFNLGSATITGSSTSIQIPNGSGPATVGMEVVAGSVSGTGGSFVAGTPYWVASVVDSTHVALAASQGGSAISPAASGSIPSLWIVDDAPGVFTPVSQTTFASSAVVNTGISMLGIDAGFINGVSAGAQNTAGIFYGNFDHLWITGCVQWGESQVNFAHIIQDAVWTFSNGTGGPGIGGGKLWKSFADASIYQPGNFRVTHDYDFNANCMTRKEVIEAQGDPNTSNASLLNEARFIEFQSNRFGTTGQVSTQVTIPSAITPTGVSGNNILVASTSTLYNDAALIYPTSAGNTFSGLTAATQTYYVIGSSIVTNTSFQVSSYLGGPAVSPGTMTGSPTFDFGSFTMTGTGSPTTAAGLANGLPVSFGSAGFSNFVSYYTFILSIIPDGTNTHIMLLANRASTVPVVTANSPGNKLLISSGFPSLEVGGWLNTGLYTGAAAPAAGALGSGYGLQGYVQNSQVLLNDLEGTAQVALYADKAQGDAFSFDQLPNSVANYGLPDYGARNSQNNLISSAEPINLDIDSGSTHTKGSGTLNTVIQYVVEWDGTFTGATPAGAGNTVVGHNDINALVQGVAFYPSQYSASLGNKLWTQGSGLSVAGGIGIHAEALTLAAARTLTGADVGLITLLTGSAETITLPTLSSTAGQALTVGVWYEIWNFSGSSMTVATQGAGAPYNQSSDNSHTLLTGHYMLIRENGASNGWDAADNGTPFTTG